MFTLHGPKRDCRRGFSRRDVLQVGALGLAGLTLADVFRLQKCQASDGIAAQSASEGRKKSVIWIWLRGGASHIDSWDMKPQAPAEIRGEFSPISTSVPGIEICEYMPLQARMMDRLAIVRGILSNDLGDHTPHYILTGLPSRGIRPSFGSIASYLRKEPAEVPQYVSTFDYDYGEAHYTGPAHQPFIPNDRGLDNLRLSRGLTVDRLDDRRQLLDQLDQLRRDVDRSGTFAGMDTFTKQAVEMVTSAKARDAFDLKKEGEATRERYGKYAESFLLARRLVEAGVSVVTVKVGDWDTHEKNFIDHRDQLPKLDQGFHALVSDLYDRGLEKDVAVVMWGEFGRAPRISRGDGRDHWPEAGAAVLAGGGFKTGQVIGETDAHGGRHKGKPYTPANVMATLYRHLGIDSSLTIPDYASRPMYILDDREPVRELI